MWGASAAMHATTLDARNMTIDGSAASAMYRFDGDLANLAFLKYDVTNLAYAIRHDGRAAIIGVGGGRDVLSAELFGFRDVTGIELNPIFIDLLTGALAGYDRLAALPGVRLIVDEARSWFARTAERFDLIQMSMIDTWAATGAGAFSLSENGLYTVEGWRTFVDRFDADRRLHRLSLVFAEQHRRDRTDGQPRGRDAVRAKASANRATPVPGRDGSSRDADRLARAVQRRDSSTLRRRRTTGVLGRW